MASQITCLTIGYSTVYSGVDETKHQSPASLAFAGNSPVIGEFPAHMASNAENVSIVSIMGNILHGKVVTILTQGILT